MQDIINLAKIRAGKIRSTLGLGEEPISNIFSLLEKEGIYLFTRDLGENASAMFMKTKDVHLVVINSKKSLGHQYFSAAHELSHYYFDKQLMGRVCQVNKYNQQNTMERLADLFASFFLMPENGILMHLDKRGILGSSGLTLNDIVSLQQYFNVSWSAMLYRLLNMHLINSAQLEDYKTTGIKRTASMLGYPCEIYSKSSKDQVSQKYIEKVITLWEKDEINDARRDEYLDIVGINSSDFRQVEEDCDAD